jgi:two-component system sensor histidine kinase RegB
MPAIARDAELSRDVEDMQAEVMRCKAIVTGILMSSGDPRGEASTQTSVRVLFDRIVADWAAARDRNVRYADEFGEDVRIASDVVLQQAVVNLLDNAAEAAASAIDVTLARDGDSLTLTVGDDGRGFAAEQLEKLGKPYNSSKVEQGHGLGLFLVSNVTRQLGGTLSVTNRDRGAAVTIRLPLDTIRTGDDER